MDKAIKQIVDAYVRLQNWNALEDLRTLRQGLLSDLKGRCVLASMLLSVNMRDRTTSLGAELEDMFATSGHKTTRSLPSHVSERRRTSSCTASLGWPTTTGVGTRGDDETL